MLGRTLRHVSRNLVAYVALIIALSSTSYAAATNLLPRNSVGTKQVINNSLLLKDFEKSQRLKLHGPRGLRGARGAQGVQGLMGPQGVKGDTGAQGPPGMVSASSVYRPESVSVCASLGGVARCPVVVLSLNAGGYAVFGRIHVVPGGGPNGAFADCLLVAAGNTVDDDNAVFPPGDMSDTRTLFLTSLVKLTSAANVSINCGTNIDRPSSVSGTRITAVEVTTLK